MRYKFEEVPLEHKSWDGNPWFAKTVSQKKKKEAPSFLNSEIQLFMNKYKEDSFFAIIHNILFKKQSLR